jgi:hypothetical protein
MGGDQRRRGGAAGFDGGNVKGGLPLRRPALHPLLD